MKSSFSNSEGIEWLFSGEVNSKFDGLGFLNQEGVLEEVIKFLECCPEWEKNNFLKLYGTFFEALPCDKTLPLLACFDPEDSFWGERNKSIVFRYLIFLFEENKAEDTKALLAYPGLKKTAKGIIKENVQLLMNYAIEHGSVDSWALLRNTQEGNKYVRKYLASIWSRALSSKSYKFIVECLTKEKTLLSSERLDLALSTFYKKNPNNQEMEKILRLLYQNIPASLFVSKAKGNVEVMEYMYEFMDEGQKEEFIQLLTNHPTFWHNLVSRESELGRECLRRDIDFHVGSQKTHTKQSLVKKM